jgi:CRISPR/Cas system-associated exonuclease Cas4 (RecB family)
MLGRIDLLVETDEAITVVDFKTSRGKWSASQGEDAGEQLLAYSELFGNSFSGKSIRLEFLVLTKTKTPSIERMSVPVSLQSIRRLQAVVTRVWRAITTGNFYPTPSPMVCSTCSFRERCRRWCG